MPPIQATFADGKIVPDAQPDWREGTRLEVQPVPVPPVRMMTEEEQGDDPESIARWLTAFDAIPIAKSSPFDEPAVTR
jgi:hypothetical protein